jgi:hypothetical protein
MQRIRV